jgi:hypothetical protein
MRNPMLQNGNPTEARTLDKMFAKHFGLELDRVEFLDSNGQKYGWITSSSFEATSPVSSQPPLIAEITMHITPNHSPWTSSVTKNPYEQLSSDGRCKVEAILFLGMRSCMNSQWLLRVCPGRT